jgi:hypothetical protein
MKDYTNGVTRTVLYSVFVYSVTVILCFTFCYRNSQYRQNHNGVYQAGKQIISYSFDVQITKTNSQ